MGIALDPPIERPASPQRALARPRLHSSPYTGAVTIEMAVCVAERRYDATLAWMRHWPVTQLGVLWEPEPALADMLPAIDEVLERVWTTYRAVQAAHPASARYWVDAHVRLVVYRDGWREAVGCAECAAEG